MDVFRSIPEVGAKRIRKKNVTMKKEFNYFENFSTKNKFVKNSYVVLLLLLLIGFISCKSDSQETHQEREVFGPDESFAPFYDKFHSDSVYQLAHINFPLQGMPQRMDSTNLAKQDFFWDKESWVIQHDFDEKETGFTKSINAVSPTMVEEKIVDKSGQFGIVRRFIKLDDEWYLIYFSGLVELTH